jgi:hypothetical protein
VHVINAKSVRSLQPHWMGTAQWNNSTR